MINTTIAHYKITSKLGQGGMGEVYRATDTKLDRDVAIKVLPESFAQDEERLKRFEREAKALAALQHPNIASIFGFEEHEGQRFLVLELVEGLTLAERLEEGPLEVAEALETGRQIAEALEAAHDKGIIHRDLKPANIKIDPQGRVKVLDFGLAKTLPPAATLLEDAANPAEAPTLTGDYTEPGKVMGTASYMSPEQSRGHDVDRRTDVWAFGCCLYETLTGKKPFKGQTPPDLVAEILKSDPDLTIIPPETPSEVLTLLRRCLDKDPRRRLRDLGDIAITLEDVTETSRVHAAIAPTTAIRETRRKPRGKANASRGWQAAALMGMVATGILGLMLLRQAEAPSQIRSLTVLPFRNLSPGDTDSQYLATTLQQALKEQLGYLASLDIKAEGSASVDATVQGTFVLVDDSYHVTVAMIDEGSQSETSLGSYTSPVTNIFPLQIEIATAVAERVRSDLTDHERRQIAAKSNIVPRAYILFRQGLEEFDKFTVEGFAKAEDFYQKSRLLDPDYVDPIVGSADLKWVPTISGATGVAPKEGIRQAKEILAGAIRLDPTHSEVLAAGGWIAMIGDWHWKEAADSFRRAIVADPGDSDSHHGISWYFAVVEGNYLSALSSIERAIALEPKRVDNLGTKAHHLMRHGDLEEALALSMELHERNPAEWHHLERAALCLLKLDRLNEAQARAMNAVDLSDRNGTALSTLAKIHVALGNREKAEDIRNELIGRSGRVYVPAFSVALVHASLGDWDSFFESIQTALDERDPMLVFNFRTLSVLDLCADQPRYWEVVDRLALPGLPIEHPYHEKELQMRFGKGLSSLSTSTEESKQRIRKLAVLPFTSITSEENQAWFADAVTQTLTTQLGKIQALSVIAHTSASQFKDSENSVPEIARQLKVDALIEGSVIRVGDQVQITANLVNGVSGETQWGDIFVDSVDDLISLQGKVALEIAKSVRITMTPENAAALAGSNPVSRKALEYYLQGVAQKGFSEEAFNTRLHFVEQAIAEDPNFASAHLFKAQTLVQLLYWDFARGDEAVKQAKLALVQALAIDPLLPEAHGLAGLIAYYIDMDFDSAEQEFAEAVKVVPNDSYTHGFYGSLLGILRRHPESITHVRMAQDLDPLSAPMVNLVSWAYFRSGDYRRALEASEEIIKLDEDSFVGFHSKAFALIGMGQDAEAEKNIRLAYEKSGRAPFYLARLGYGLGLLGQKEEAAKLLKQLHGIAQADPEAVQAFQFGLLYLGMGEDDKAIEWFERALDEGDMAIVYVGSNFYWDADRKPLRDNPKYQSLLRRIGLPE